MYTIEQLMAHKQEVDSIEDFLDAKAREWDSVQPDRKIRANGSNFYLEEWYINVLSEEITMTYLETWKFGGEGYHYITIPFKALTEDISVLAEEARRKAAEEEEAKKAKALEDAKESRRKLYEQLKAEFDDWILYDGQNIPEIGNGIWIKLRNGKEFFHNTTKALDWEQTSPNSASHHTDIVAYKFN